MGLVHIECHTCKVPFGLDRPTYDTLFQSCATFFCPFGHGQNFVRGESEETKLRRERDRLKQDAARLLQEQEELRAEAAAAERRASAARGQVTKLKNRAAAGVCPCCNRQFVDLKRHMAGKHPTFLAEEVEGEKADG